MAEKDEGTIGADWAIGAEGTIGSEGAMGAQGAEGADGAEGAEEAEGAEDDEGAAIHILLDGFDTLGMGYMALWGFRAKCWMDGVEWMDGYPLDCYDYQSTCGAKNINFNSPGDTYKPGFGNFWLSGIS